MKNILLVGASSDAAKSLYKNYKENVNFVRLSRSSDYSNVEDFDVLEPETYFKSDLKYDGLVYFPGTIRLRPFKQIKIEDFQTDFDINVIGLIKIFKYYLPSFNLGCSVVFISSVAASIGMPFHSSVSVSKSAILGLCKSLSAEFAPTYRVNCISPSLFNSKMSERFLKNDAAVQNIKEKNPLNMIGESNDIASLIYFLLSSDSKWITGQDFAIDGGMSVIKK